MSDLSQTQRATEKRKASLHFTLDDGRVDQELIFSIYGTVLNTMAFSVLTAQNKTPFKPYELVLSSPLHFR